MKILIVGDDIMEAFEVFNCYKTATNQIINYDNVIFLRSDMLISEDDLNNIHTIILERRNDGKYKEYAMRSFVNYFNDLRESGLDNNEIILRKGSFALRVIEYEDFYNTGIKNLISIIKYLKGERS